MFYLLSGYSYAYVFQQCVDDYYYSLMLSYCQTNKQEWGYNYFFEGELCCYSYHDYYYADLKSCFCASDYCNNYILEPGVITQSNDTTTSTWYSPQNMTSSPGNSTGFVNCYSCWYSGVANNVSTNITCEEPFVSYDGGSCGGEACVTYASASEGKLFCFCV